MEPSDDLPAPPADESDSDLAVVEHFAPPPPDDASAASPAAAAAALAGEDADEPGSGVLVDDFDADGVAADEDANAAAPAAVDGMVSGSDAAAPAAVHVPAPSEADLADAQRRPR